ncbi:MAG: ABC transporter substrate-binding protein [Termitinemataceae bacterium]|nr:MAG: ABC transporter substrate-binding protein [Termitinemataceae bacterium]
MKKNFIFVMMALAVFSLLTACSKTEEVNIGISKIVQHVALDAVEQGIVDGLDAKGVKANFDLQNANGDMSTAAQIAGKFKAEKVNVAVGIATPTAQALANAIKDIPIVFATVTDPIGAGLVTTLEHGEGNITGLSDALPVDYHISLFKEIAGIKSLGYIYTSSEANSISALNQVDNACRNNGIELVVQAITTSADIRQAAQAIIDRVDGLYLTTDNTVFSGLSAIISVFKTAKKPIFSGDVTGALGGGCMIASGFDYYKAGIACADIIYQILQGAKPSDIPVKLLSLPSETDFLLDLDAAANCGITINENYIMQANKIFENGKLSEK